jgi:hypothetical protein
VTWADSASKHGVPREDAMWALTHFIYEERGFEVARPPATVAPDLYIGRSGQGRPRCWRSCWRGTHPRACGYFTSCRCVPRSERE